MFCSTAARSDRHKTSWSGHSPDTPQRCTQLNQELRLAGGRRRPAPPPTPAQHVLSGTSSTTESEPTGTPAGPRDSAIDDISSRRNRERGDTARRKIGLGSGNAASLSDRGSGISTERA